MGPGIGLIVFAIVWNSWNLWMPGRHRLPLSSRVCLTIAWAIVGSLIGPWIFK